MAFAVAFHVVFLIVCRVLRKILRVSAVEEAAIYYSNSGNMIIPLVAAVLGKDMLLYASAFFCVQTIFMWTHGVTLVSGNASSDWKKLLTNPNLIAVVIGLIMFVTGLRLSELVQMPVDALASIVGPISMVTIGMILTRVEWGSLLTNKRLYLIAALRMLVIPLITLLAIYLLQRAMPQIGEGNILLVSFMAVIAPTAVSVMQMANLYHRDEVYAGMICAVTTLVCIVSMPMMVALYTMIM